MRLLAPSKSCKDGRQASVSPCLAVHTACPTASRWLTSPCPCLIALTGAGDPTASWPWQLAMLAAKKPGHIRCTTLWHLRACTEQTQVVASGAGVGEVLTRSKVFGSEMIGSTQRPSGKAPNNVREEAGWGFLPSAASDLAQRHDKS